MAKHGSSKWWSVLQERRISRFYGGAVSPSSGGAESDQGDVRASKELIECKHTGQFAKPAKSISLKLDDVEKIVDEAWSEGRRPAVALSIYAPDSILAGTDGCVDLIVRLVTDDVALLDTEWRYEDLG